MLSKRSTSNAVRAAVALTALLAVGCAKTPQAGVPAATRAYVRLAALTPAHPMQREVARLSAMEQTLRAVPAMAATETMQGELPSLPETGAQTESAAAAQERRNKERSFLREQGLRQLQEFAAGRRARTARLLDQQRAEMLSALAAQDAINAINANDAIAAGIIAQLLELTKKKLEIYGRLAVLTGQLDADMDYVAPAPSAERATRPLTPLAAAGSAPRYPTMRERLQAERRVQLGELREIDAAINTVKRNGRLKISDADRKAQAARIEEIEARLNALRDDAEIAQVVRDQLRALEAALQVEENAWRINRQETNGVRGTGALRLTALTPLTAGASLSTSVAVEHLVRQRAELERLITVSTRDAVRDAARVRNIDIRILGSDKTPPRAGVEGETDMTSEFKNWLASGRAATPTPPVSAAGKRGRS